MKLTPIQRAALEHIDRDGRWHGMYGNTVDSLRRHGLIELATVSNPHLTNPYAF